MIVDLLFGFVKGLLTIITSILPTVSIASVLGSLHGRISDVVSFMAPWNSVFPVQETVTLIGMVVAVWVPCVVAYVVAEWVWRHIPSVAGFGTGNG